MLLKDTLRLILSSAAFFTIATAVNMFMAGGLGLYIPPFPMVAYRSVCLATSLAFGGFLSWIAKRYSDEELTLVRMAAISLFTGALIGAVSGLIYACLYYPLHLAWLALMSISGAVPFSAVGLLSGMVSLALTTSIRKSQKR